MKRSEAWFPTARHVFLIAEDSLYQDSSTLISDITDQYRLPSMERDLLECNSSQFTGVSNDRGISQTGACCTLKTQPISSNITPPTWIDLKKNVFTYRDTETHFLVRHQHRHLYLYQIQLCSFYQQLCMPTKQIVIFLWIFFVNQMVCNCSNFGCMLRLGDTSYK